MSIRFTVVHTAKAENQLIEMWMNAPPGERAHITRASHLLESELRQDADQKGIPVKSPDKPYPLFLDCRPLRAYFDVSEPDRLVRIHEFERLEATP
jgi:hypothetical protein